MNHKLPQITLAFWVMKICATTLGETAGDLLSMTLNVSYAISSLILFGLFAITLVSQLASKKYHPVLYWSVILSTSTAGTTMGDVLTKPHENGGLGFGTIGSSAVLAVVLAGAMVYTMLRLKGSAAPVPVKVDKP